MLVDSTIESYLYSQTSVFRNVYFLPKYFIVSVSSQLSFSKWFMAPLLSLWSPERKHWSFEPYEQRYMSQILINLMIIYFININLTSKETVECFKLFVYCLNKQLSAGDIECVEWVLKHAIIIKFKWKFFKILQHQTKTIGVSFNLFYVKKEWSVDDRWWSGSMLMIICYYLSVGIFWTRCWITLSSLSTHSLVKTHFNEEYYFYNNML